MTQTNIAAAAEQVANEASRRLEQLGDEMDSLDRQLRRVVQDRPLAVLGVAVLTGYVLARLLRR